MSDVKFNAKSGKALIRYQSSAAIIDLGFKAFSVPAATEKDIKIASSKIEDTDDTIKYVEWGTGDNWPVKTVESAEYDTVITPGLRFKTNMQYGGGVACGKIEVSDQGKEVFKYERNRDFISFSRANQLGLQILTSFYDLNYFANAVVLVTLSNDRQKIVRYNTQIVRMKHVRFGRRNTFGEIEKIFVNPDFGTSEYDEQNTKEYPVMPSYGAVNWLQEKRPAAAAYILKIPDSGRQYYPMPDWYSAVNSKWVEISKAIALFKKYLMENQLSIKYHIKVHPQFWEQYYGDAWHDFEPDEKITKAGEWLDALNEFFKGAKGAGNSLMTFLADNPSRSGDYSELVKIDEIGGKFNKDGTYIEDSKEASEHKISALELHPDLVGSSPGSNLGSGSGSGNRVAFNQRVAMAKPVQDMVLYPLYIVAEFNGWDPDLEFRMRESLITTLDTGASATKPSAEA